MFRLCSILLLCLCTAQPLRAEIVGALRVIDGDTFDVAGTRIRLVGVDAPEAHQNCTTTTGASFACGAWVSRTVRASWQGQRASCAPQGTDRYGRTLATCQVAGEDLGAVLVRRGLAFAYRAYSTAYVGEELAARRAGTGIWAYRVESPAAWRAAERQVAAPSPGTCAIKGNISSRGRLYHLPGSRGYSVTRIDTSRGERWFCTEAEARAAGWRPARAP
ncbi:MAG: thermonuclease family protein [Limimaricola sp.]|uniref:thermonuclease family protein n=1 Tax=Limimaricola sp. TaxID=2211665 RepID=UPI001DC83354|nr:thermonuclease family protein [Limimaricola sp.]MBI1416343.1 thermonuclease family protein [Limimaricola sp.]